MSRIFVSEATGARVYVFSGDHCPAHVHARHRGEEWIARVSFSYINSTIELMSIAPTRNVPLQRLVNRLLGDIEQRLSDCRRSWWTIRRTTCLTNQWAIVPELGRIEFRSESSPEAKQIAEAQYDPENESIHIAFREEQPQK